MNLVQRKYSIVQLWELHTQTIQIIHRIWIQHLKVMLHEGT